MQKIKVQGYYNEKEVLVSNSLIEKMNKLFEKKNDIYILWYEIDEEAFLTHERWETNDGKYSGYKAIVNLRNPDGMSGAVYGGEIEACYSTEENYINSFCSFVSWCYKHYIDKQTKPPRKKLDCNTKTMVIGNKVVCTGNFDLLRNIEEKREQYNDKELIRHIMTYGRNMPIDFYDIKEIKIEKAANGKVERIILIEDDRVTELKK